MQRKDEYCNKNSEYWIICFGYEVKGSDNAKMTRQALLQVENLTKPEQL